MLGVITERIVYGRVKKVGWIGLALVAMSVPTIILWYQLSVPKHPADDVELWSWETAPSGGAVGQTESDLKNIIISKIDFQDEPFMRSLEYVFEKLNKERQHKHEIKFTVLDAEEFKDVVIMLKLSNVPVMTALKYITALAECTFSIEPDGSLLIATLDSHPEPSIKRKFLVDEFVFPNYTGQGPYDVISELEAVGMGFKLSDTAEYYPDREVLVVQVREDQMELLDAYLSSSCVIYQLSMIEKIKFLIQGFFAPPASLPAVPIVLPSTPLTGPAVDPFAPDPSSNATPVTKGNSPFQ